MRWMRVAMIAALAGALGLAGCGDKKQKRAEQARAVETPAPPQAFDAVERWAGWLPADAQIVVVADGSQVQELLLMAMPPERDYNTEARAQHVEALERDLRRQTLDRLGVSFLGAERIVMAASRTSQVALLLGEVELHTVGEPVELGGQRAVRIQGKGEAADLGPGSDVWAVELEGGAGVALFPSRPILERVLGAEPGARGLAGRPERLERFAGLFERAPRLNLTAAAILDDEQLRQILTADLPAPPPEAALLSLTREAELVLEGPDQDLAKLKTAYQSGMSAVGAQLQSTRREYRDIGNGPESVGAIWAFHTFNAWRDSVQITGPEQGAMVMRAPLPPEVTPPVLVGGAAAVVIPYMLRAMNEARTAEAEQNLEQIARAAARHYERSGADGQPCAFPPAAGPTPRPFSCCGAGPSGEDLCQPSEAWGEAEGWSQLGFAPDGPHRFVYQTELEPRGEREQLMILRAMADMGCDGGARHTVEITLIGRQDDQGACLVQRTPTVVLDEFE